jgi:hypothetical protein
MMTNKISDLLPPWLKSLLLLITTLLIISGVWQLETNGGQSLLGYLPLLAGALALTLSPKSDGRYSIINLVSSRTTSLLLLIACLLCASALYTPTLLVLSGSIPREISVPKLASLWFGAVASFLAFCGSLDYRRRISIPIPAIREIILIGGIFSISFLARCWGPDSWVVDEISQVIEITHHSPQGVAPIGASSTTYPYFLLYVFYLIHQATHQFIDLLPLLKLISYIASSLSIVFIYCIARLISSQRIATYAALLMTVWGWHWINSRFVYAYPIDMANVTFGLLMFVLATRFSSLTCAALAGISCALALITQKVGVMMLPLLGFLALEEMIIAKSRTKRLGLLIALITIGCSSIIAYEPELIVLQSSGGQFARQKEAAELRATVLPQMGLNAYTATAWITWDGLKQIQTAIFDRSRHVFRPDAPILDPVFSALFSIGLIFSLINIRSFRAGRLAIVGMLIFILPMALSFPVESPNHGLARRMICASFFIAWLAGIGTDALSTRLVSPKRSYLFGSFICTLSMLVNVYYALTVYSHPPVRDWYEMGNRALPSTAMMKLAREAGRNKIPTVIFEQFNADTQEAASNFPEATRTFNFADFRNVILSRKGRLQLVILPWDTQIAQRDSQKTAQDLSDIIPTYLWIPGERDPQGVPMLRYAYVRIP